MKYKKALFIFRRDLRLYDNTALHAALAQSEIIIPCFIIDPRQTTNKNEYRSNNALQFMAESIEAVAAEIKKEGGTLSLFSGHAATIVEQLITEETIDAVFYNKDYTPFSRMRDEAIAKVCAKHGLAHSSFHDTLLNEPNLIMNGSKKPYAIFSAYTKKASLISVAALQKLKLSGIFSHTKISFAVPLSTLHDLYTENKNILLHGGRSQAVVLLRSIKQHKQYAHDKDYPALDTTHLSAHLKFGTLSARELYQEIAQQFGKQHELVRQLYWRDFYTYLLYHTPRLLGSAYHEKYNDLTWSNDKKKFAAWCTGETGFPIVDAGMRELNTTGFMHNRVRMIVASFLIKDLHIDWQWGEKYFAQQLIDYDPAVNNGNWQWVASTGASAQPYFRIFNPWQQQKKFDSETVYIKKWIPELRNTTSKIIHTWFKETHTPIKGYPRPIVDHTIEAAHTKKYYAMV